MAGPTHASDLRLLDPAAVRLSRDRFDRMHLQIGIEERYGPVRAVRALPLTQPDRFISIQDEDGEELGILPDLRQLDAESRKALERELELYYLKARVTAIKKVESRNGLITWDLETDLGSKRIHVRDRQNIRSLPGGVTVITDIHGGKYEIPPSEELDERSRHWLEIEL